jgi:hypothetical protein
VIAGYSIEEASGRPAGAHRLESSVGLRDGAALPRGGHAFKMKVGAFDSPDVKLAVGCTFR